MSTSTARLQLTKPLGSESMVLGAAQLNDAYSKIDAAVGVKKFATQGAATATFPGDLIVETSTGQSKLFNNPNWINFFDPNNCKGFPQVVDVNGNDSFIVSGFPEQTISVSINNTQAGRKYLINYNLSLSAQNDGGTPLQGYVRFVFKYIADVTPGAPPPNIFIHDSASFISCTNSSRSKNFKGMFEFFPNYTGGIQLGLFAQIITGAQDLVVNLNGSTPKMYMMDWGV